MVSSHGPSAYTFSASSSRSSAVRSQLSLVATRSPTYLHCASGDGGKKRGVFAVVACGDFDADERDLLLSVWVGADDRNLPVTVLDLSGVTFGDSSFLDSLLLAHRRHHAASRRLVLAGPLHRLAVLLLTVTGTLPHFETAASLTDALRDHTPT